MKKNWFEECKPILGMVGLMLIFSGVTLISKDALNQGMNTRVFIVYRQAFASLVLVPTAIMQRRRQSGGVALGIKGFCGVFLASLIGITIFQNLYFIGLHLAPSSIASAMFNLTPAITMVMATSVGLEKIKMDLRSLAKVLGTISSLGGVIIMTMFKGPQLLHMESPTSHLAIHSADQNWKIGCAILFVSICLWSLWLVVQAPLCKNYFDPPSLSAWMSFLSFLQSATLTLIWEHNLRVWKLNSSLEFLCCLYTGVMGTGVTYYVQSWCISKRGPVFVAMFYPLLTVMTTILAFLLLHEELYIGSLAGAAAVVTGLYAVLWGKAKDHETQGKQSSEDHNARIVVSIGETSLSSEDDMKKPFIDQ